MKEWHYIRRGKQIGPASSKEFINKKNSGEIAPTDLVWTDGMAEWLPFMEVADLGRSGSVSLTGEGYEDGRVRQDAGNAVSLKNDTTKTFPHHQR